jgi:hypothetical protein
MMIICLLILVFPGHAFGNEAKSGEKDKLVSGMSIVGNDEAPKSLVIVPWKSSELGGALDISYAADNGPRPVDREVFSRALSYYEIRAAVPTASEGRRE